MPTYLGVWSLGLFSPTFFSTSSKKKKKNDSYLMSVFMDLNTMFWNCQGVSSKRKELEFYLKENNFDIVTLNETFLTKKINFKIQGSDTIKSDRSTGVRGGVAFHVKHGLVINKEYRNADNIITDNEALVIDIDLSNKPKSNFGYHLLPKWKS